MNPAGGLGAAVIEDHVYAVGGFRESESVNELARYDPATDRWEVLPAMPTPRDHLGAGVINGRLYVVAGRNQTTSPSGPWKRSIPGGRTCSARSPRPPPGLGSLPPWCTTAWWCVEGKAMPESRAGCSRRWKPSTRRPTAGSPCHRCPPRGMGLGLRCSCTTFLSLVEASCRASGPPMCTRCYGCRLPRCAEARGRGAHGLGWTGSGGLTPTRVSPTRHVILHGCDRRRAQARGQCARHVEPLVAPQHWDEPNKRT